MFTGPPPTTIDRRERPRHDWRLLGAGLRICPSFNPRYAVAQIYSHMSYYLLINSLVSHENTKQGCRRTGPRSEEHTSELQSLMRISYAVFCLTKKKTS